MEHQFGCIVSIRCGRFCGYKEWVFEGKHSNATVVFVLEFSGIHWSLSCTWETGLNSRQRHDSDGTATDGTITAVSCCTSTLSMLLSYCSTVCQYVEREDISTVTWALTSKEGNLIGPVHVSDKHCRTQVSSPGRQCKSVAFLATVLSTTTAPQNNRKPRHGQERFMRILQFNCLVLTRMVSFIVIAS